MKPAQAGRSTRSPYFKIRAICVLVTCGHFAKLAFMKLLKFILSGMGIFLLGACSSSKKSSNELYPQGARVLDESAIGKKYSALKNIQVDEEGAITGGKRSMYDRASDIKGYRKDYKTPDYLTKNFDQKQWNGRKDYSTGSYQGTSQARETGQNSRFQGDKSGIAGQKSWLGNKKYDTGSYQTSGARESQKAAIQGGENAQVAHRKKVWGWDPKIYSADEYREMTVSQTRSLLGKDK